MSLSDLRRATPAFRCSHSTKPGADLVRNGILNGEIQFIRKAGGWAVTGKSFEHSERAMAQRLVPLPSAKRTLSLGEISR